MLTVPTTLPDINENLVHDKRVWFTANVFDLYVIRDMPSTSRPTGRDSSPLPAPDWTVSLIFCANYGFAVPVMHPAI
jgi:hypothetical protein